MSIFTPYPANAKRRREEKAREEEAAARRKERTALNQAHRDIALLERAQRALQARDDLLGFTEFTMPHPDDPGDIRRSRYEPAPFHGALARHLEQLVSGTLLHKETGERCRQIIISMPPRAGKACAHDTPVLTPAGWRTHGDLQAGDFVFGSDGTPVKVLGVSKDVDEVVPVRLTNGDVIRCHPNHEWTVFDRSRGAWRTVETRYMAGRALRCGPEGRGGRFIFQLPDVKALEFPEAELPLHPYVLGAWLGDGTAASTRMAHDVKDVAVVQAVEALGHAVSSYFVQPGTGVAYTSFSGPRPGVGSSMQKALRALTVLNNKHVPESYLRSSVEQRLQLLAGLIDTDGHVCPSTGRVAFTTCSAALRDGVYDVATTLGFRPYTETIEPRTSTSGIVGRKETYRVGFQPTMPLPVRLERKQVAKFALRRRVAIESIGPVEKAPARSIQVDRADGLYAVGRTCVMTHNTELAVRRMTAWFLGKFPYKEVAVATYSDTKAVEEGGAVRAIMNSSQYKQVFPNFQFRKGGNAREFLQSREGGKAVFVGLGGALTGRGADLLVCDDLIKGADEARSKTMRDQAWEWFTRVAMTRRMGDKLVVLIMTRWHSDDIIGRLTDPSNKEYYHEELAREWMTIKLAALAERDDPLGRAIGEPLWPERFSLKDMRQMQLLDPLGFSALYQQSPTVADGVLFRRENIQRYRPDDLPRDLRIYCASDHAVSTAQRADSTVLLKAGVDKQNNIWLLDCFWDRVPTDRTVEAMLAMGRDQPPLFWWAEKGHISKSIGPFLYKRMEEAGIYLNIIEVTPAADKETRAQPIAARVAMGKLYVPQHAPWAEMAIEQMLQFPNGTHDDFVDALAHLGGGLQHQFGPSKTETKKAEPKYGTLDWMKANTKAANDRARPIRFGAS